MGYYLNKEKALNNFLDTFRFERDKKFKELDIEFMKALEVSDSDTQTNIANHKNTLRNFPNTISVDSFNTIEELNALWPVSHLDSPF